MHGHPCEIYPPPSFNPNCPPPNIPRCTVDSSGAPVPVTSSGSNGPASSYYGSQLPATPTDVTQSQGVAPPDAQLTGDQSGAAGGGGLFDSGASTFPPSSSSGSSGTGTGLGSLFQARTDRNDQLLGDLIKECGHYRMVYSSSLELDKLGTVPLQKGVRKATEKAIEEIDDLVSTMQKAKDRNWLRRFLTAGDVQKQIERFRARRQQIIDVQNVQTGISNHECMSTHLETAKVHYDELHEVLLENRQVLASKEWELEELKRQLALSPTSSQSATPPPSNPIHLQAPKPESTASGRRASSSSSPRPSSTNSQRRSRSRADKHDTAGSDDSDAEPEHQDRRRRHSSAAPQRQSRPRSYRQADYEEDEYTYRQPRRAEAPPPTGRHYHPHHRAGVGAFSSGCGNVIGNSITNVGNVSSYTVRTGERRPPPRRQQCGPRY